MATSVSTENMRYYLLSICHKYIMFLSLFPSALLYRPLDYKRTLSLKLILFDVTIFLPSRHPQGSGFEEVK